MEQEPYRRWRLAVFASSLGAAVVYFVLILLAILAAFVGLPGTGA